MTTIAINFDFIDLFKEDEKDSVEEKYSCVICSELVYKQEWYQCKEGHPSCSKCWNTIISHKGTKQCPFCRKPVKSLNDLSRCRFIEQEFLNKKILCPYFKEYFKGDKVVPDIENGCKEIIIVEQLDNHQKNCNSRFVKCDNKGCGTVSRYFQNLQHEKECSHAIIKCPQCNTQIKRLSLPDHQKTCPSRIIKCTQCPTELKKSNLKSHIDKACPNTIIPCKFQQYGCNNKFKRSELSSHLQQVDHTEILIKLIDKKSQQINQQSKELQKQSQQLQQQSQELKQQLEQIKQQSITLDKKSQQINQQSQMLNFYKKNLDKQIEVNNQKENEYESRLARQLKQLKQFSYVNEELNNNLQNIKLNTTYCNKWIIPNFNERSGAGKPPIYSPEIYLPPYRFKIGTSTFQDPEKSSFLARAFFGDNKKQNFYLYAVGSFITQTIFTLKLLNCKDITKTLVFRKEQELSESKSSGGSFSINQYSKESGYLFPDGSIEIEFTIQVIKPALRS